jgi:RND family efflux transporter MFP subunit
VGQGTALLRIDATSYQRDIVDREKDLSTARANYTTAQAETEQARENYARLDLGEPNDIVLKIPELTAARLAVESSEAALAIAERNLAETTVIAPYNGIISTTGVVLGDLVGNGANLGTLTGTELFRVRFPILESQIALAQVGSEITIETTTQPVISKIGIVKAIDIDIEADTRLNAVIVAVQAPLEGDILRLGRFVNGAFIGAPIEDVFAIPLNAVNNDGNYFLIGPDNRLIATTATPVYRDFQAIYVAAEGLAEIEIVVGNALGLRGGMLVQGYAQ